MTVISEEEYMEMCNDNMGFCQSCKSFTRDCTEPDADNYDCPDCGQNLVVGAENALIMGLIDFG